MLVLALALSGCSTKPKIETVPVIVRPNFPPVAKACKAAIPELEKVQLNFAEKQVLEQYKAGTDADRQKILVMYRKQIEKLLDALIRAYAGHAVVVRNIKACRNHIKRVRQLGE